MKLYHFCVPRTLENYGCQLVTLETKVTSHNAVAGKVFLHGMYEFLGKKMYAIRFPIVSLLYLRGSPWELSHKCCS